MEPYEFSEVNSKDFFFYFGMGRCKMSAEYFDVTYMLLALLWLCVEPRLWGGVRMEAEREIRRLVQ